VREDPDFADRINHFQDRVFCVEGCRRIEITVIGSL
jgi:hypothetical protein